MLVWLPWKHIVERSRSLWEFRVKSNQSTRILLSHWLVIPVCFKLSNQRTACKTVPSESYHKTSNPCPDWWEATLVYLVSSNQSSAYRIVSGEIHVPQVIFILIGGYVSHDKHSSIWLVEGDTVGMTTLKLPTVTPRTGSYNDFVYDLFRLLSLTFRRRISTFLTGL